MNGSSFGLLSKDLQKIVYEMRWESLTPIQERAISAILQTDMHVVITAGTASGKTEAAFLPILSMVQETAKERLNVLYISPLRALINDQFTRIERLCKDLDIPVHKWHGDVESYRKKQVLTMPAGILQITPESLEALFVNRPQALPSLFQDVTFIVVDEVHAFLGRDRGVHLQSLLGRIACYTRQTTRIVALSATLGDSALAKAWVDPLAPERVLIVSAEEQNQSGRVLFALEYVSVLNPDRTQASTGYRIPQAVVQDIRELTRHHSAMIFCNSRSHAEELGVRLNELVQWEMQAGRIHGLEPGAALYLIHHSSIDRKERETVEQLMRSTVLPRSVICTSSLELGIDIGNVDLVIQVDATWSVSSLKQRIGRSGRRQGKDRILQMYVLEPMGLLQAIAVTELMKSGWVEPGTRYPIPYDVLFHQMLSLCAEHHGLSRQQLIGLLRKIGPFLEISDVAIRRLLEHAKEQGYLERLAPDQWIVGVQGERILRSAEFYSIFQTPEEYEVYFEGKRLGTIEKNGLVDVGSNLMLGGRLWAIVRIDNETNHVFVTPSTDGTPPRYSGLGVKRDHTVACKMAEILFSEDRYPYLMPQAQAQLQGMREQLADLRQQLTPRHRLVQRYLDGRYVFQMFAGTDIQRTFQWMVRALGHSARINAAGHVEVVLSRTSPVHPEGVETGENGRFGDLVAAVLSQPWTPDMLLPHVRDSERLQTKYSAYLPQEFRDQMHMDSEMDIEATLSFLREIRLVEIENY
jgi:ATP-dependent Lhr-like helicase